jgi:hypothetical protein
MQHTVIKENFNSNRVMMAILSWMGSFFEVNSSPELLDVFRVSRFIVLISFNSFSFTVDWRGDGPVTGVGASVAIRSLGTLFS